MKIADLWAGLSIRPEKQSFNTADRLLSGIKTALVGIVAFKSVKWATGIIDQTAQTADQFNKMAKTVGISSEALQGLEFAAGLSGTNIEVLRNALQRFARTADDANEGSKQAQDTFKRFGISAKTADGSMKPLDQILGEVADKISTMPDGTEKTALAIRAFGRSGAQLIPLLNEGSAGITAMRKEFKDLGAEIDTDTGKAFEKFNDTQLRLKTVLTGLRNQAVSALLPVLQQLADDVLNWVKANRELIKQKLQSVLRGLISALRFLARAFGFVVDAIAFMNEHWKLTVMVIGSVTAALLILKAGSIQAAIATGAAWLASMAPFILMAGAILAVVLIVEDFWVALNGGQSVLGRLWEAFSNVFGQKIADLLGISLEDWKNSFQEFSDWVIAKIQAVIDKVTHAFGEVKRMINFLREDKSQSAAEKERREQAGRAFLERSGLGSRLSRNSLAYQLLGPGRNAGISKSNVTNNSVNQSASVVVNAQGLSAQEVANEVDKKLNGTLRGAAGSL